jgi:ribosomal 50S subunit-recycling heat shock protein
MAEIILYGVETERVRLDRWLWAARFFKTRALSSAAIAGGKVQVNGTRAKPAKQLQVGDQVRVRLGPYDWHVTVRAARPAHGGASIIRGIRGGPRGAGAAGQAPQNGAGPRL